MFIIYSDKIYDLKDWCEKMRYFDPYRPDKYSDIRCHLKNGHYVDVWDATICNENRRNFQPITRNDMSQHEFESIFQNMSQRDNSPYRYLFWFPITVSICTNIPYTSNNNHG